MRFQEFKSEDMFWQMAQEEVELSIREALHHHPTARLALAGGSTPKPLYRRLALAKLPWESLQFVTNDERYVPWDDSKNNARMIYEAMLEHLPVQPEFLHFETDLPLEESTQKVDGRLRQWEGEREPLLDLLVLGMGSDGHIASLFPGQEALWPKGRYAFPVHQEGLQVEDRLTLSLEVLRKARRALILLKGEEKEGIFKKLKSKISPHLKELESLKIQVFHLVV